MPNPQKAPITKSPKYKKLQVQKAPSTKNSKHKSPKRKKASSAKSSKCIQHEVEVLKLQTNKGSRHIPKYIEVEA